jgi:hypothetical protein
MNGRRSLFGAILALALAVGLVAAAPAGATGKYTDATGDNGSAPDLTGVRVSSDKTSGQVVFQISGNHLSSTLDYPTFLDIDSDANPLTGDIGDNGVDYEFAVGGHTYGFWHYDGSGWVDASYATVRVFVTGSGVMISVNKSEIGNSNDFNLAATSADWQNNVFDSAPDTGMFNYSLDDGGPSIVSIALATTPTAGPKAGKKFVVTPSGLTLPPSGALLPTTPAPDSYTCTATFKGHALVGHGTGGCTFAIPKKKSRGKTLKVTVTVQYEGASKAFPYSFKVT